MTVNKRKKPSQGKHVSGSKSKGRENPAGKYKRKEGSLGKGVAAKSKGTDSMAGKSRAKEQQIGKFKGKEQHAGKFKGKEQQNGKFKGKEEYSGKFKGKEQQTGKFKGKEQQNGRFKGKEAYSGKFRGQEEYSGKFKGKEQLTGKFKGKEQKTEKFKGKEQYSGKYNRKRAADDSDSKAVEEEEEFETVPADFQTPCSDPLQDDIEDETGKGETVKRKMERKIQAVNRKGCKTGGFQSFGLTPTLFKAIQHKGYKIPTPIQRKSIPMIMDGRDVVSMSRTGSGKTAAFLIPMIERLKFHSAKVGARGLVLSPSRELALQTLKFTKELCKYNDLRMCMLVGGESMEEHFKMMASNPDIIIATPGRLMHLTVEMNLELKTIEYVVFDEADRLYELGFAEHMNEILSKLPENRQTLLFSATLPKSLVEFARAGLTDPALIRLDMDTKVSKELQMVFFSLNAEEKEAALLYILENMIKLTDEKLAMIFAPTKHHVDYLHELLKAAGIESTYIYGALDQTARKIHLARFRAGSVRIMIVTDVAARGIDIPLLDYVINYEFPGSPKVFVHRVGRVARAGRSGTAISLVSTDELPFLVDLQLFLGRPLILGSVYEDNAEIVPNYCQEIILGKIPPSVIGMEVERVASMRKENSTVAAFLDSSRNAFKLYLRTRQGASQESYSRAKELLASKVGMHPMIIEQTGRDETVFEVGKNGAKSAEAILMGKRRRGLTGVIKAAKVSRADSELEMLRRQTKSLKRSLTANEAVDGDIRDTFSNTRTDSAAAKSSDSFKDAENYMSHYQAGASTEAGYAMKTKPTSFLENVKSAVMDINGDDRGTMNQAKGRLMWDKKKHKFVRPTIGADNKKMITTESGAKISASYKSDRYADWQKKTKTSIPRAGEQELSNAKSFANAINPNGRHYRHNSMTAPTPNSKSSVRKSLKRAKEAGDSNGGSSGKDGMVSVKRGGSGMRTRMVPRKVTGDASNSRRELKTGQQIAKARKEKERRREKTGRHKK